MLSCTPASRQSPGRATDAILGDPGNNRDKSGMNRDTSVAHPASSWLILDGPGRPECDPGWNDKGVFAGVIREGRDLPTSSVALSTSFVTGVIPGLSGMVREGRDF